jgi:hypothetical protein
MDGTIHKMVADVAVLARSSVLLVRYGDTSKYDRQVGWFPARRLLGARRGP